MNTDTTTTREIAVLGFAIEACGIHADPVTLLLLAHAARDLGVNELLVNVMVDEDAPANARIRAFARVSSEVSLAISEPTATPQRELLPAC